jgi:glutamine synthetase adenylyltransferase
VPQPKKLLLILKYARGCIVNIEFLVQYAALAWGQAYPAVASWTNNIHILGFSEGLA